MLRLISQLFGLQGNPAAAASPAALPPLPPEPAEAPAAASHDFEERLREICKDRQMLSSGRLHVLNLQGMRVRFGAKWPLVSEKVNFLAKRTIEQRLGPSDYHAEIAENVFAIVFAESRAAAAAVKCSAIAREITSRLFGDEDGGAQVQIHSAKLDGAGKLSMETVDPLAAVVRALAAPAPKPAESSPRPGFKQMEVPGSGKPASHLADEPPTGAAAPSKDSGPAGELAYQQDLYKLMRLMGTAQNDIADWRSYQASATRVHYAPQLGGGANGPAAKAASAAPEASARPAPSTPPARHLTLPGSLSNAKFAYTPVWRADQSAITSYQCDLRFEGDEGIATLEEIFSDDVDPSIAFLADMLALRKALSDLSRCVSEGKKAIIGAQFHYTTAASKQLRMKYLAALEEVPAALRRLFILEMTNLYTADWSRLGDIVAPFSKACRSVALRLSLDQPVRPELASSGAREIGGDLRDHDWTEEHALKDLLRFAEGAREVGLESYVFGLDTKSLAIAATGAGFHYVAGNTIAPAVDKPGGVHSFGIVDLYR